jgi:antitoxin CcdA
MNHTHKKPSKKRPVTLSVRQDVLAEAKALDINVSQIAEDGLVDAIRKAKEAAWLEENAEAIKQYNKNIDKYGIFYTPDWMKSDGEV